MVPSPELHPASGLPSLDLPPPPPPSQSASSQSPDPASSHRLLLSLPQSPPATISVVLLRLYRPASIFSSSPHLLRILPCPDLRPCPDPSSRRPDPAARSASLPRRPDPLRYAAALPKFASQPSLPRSALAEVEDEYHEVGQGGKVSVSEKVVKDETNETDVVAPKQRSEYKISKNGKEDDKQEFRAAFDKLCEKDSLLAMEGPPTTLFNESKGVEATEIVTNELHKMFKIYESHSTPRKASNVVGECNEGKTDRANAFYVKDEIGFGDCLEQNGAEWCNLG
ncbi:hypothetical protein ACLOJK_040585 [Asimina triloba]